MRCVQLDTGTQLIQVTTVNKPSSGTLVVDDSQPPSNTLILPLPAVNPTPEEDLNEPTAAQDTNQSAIPNQYSNQSKTSLDQAEIQPTAKKPRHLIPLVPLTKKRSFCTSNASSITTALPDQRGSLTSDRESAIPHPPKKRFYSSSHASTLPPAPAALNQENIRRHNALFCRQGPVRTSIQQPKPVGPDSIYSFPPKCPSAYIIDDTSSAVHTVKTYNTTTDAENGFRNTNMRDTLTLYKFIYPT